MHIPEKMFMCYPHWSMVPRALQKALLGLYRPGQEQTKDPSREYLAIAHECIEAVAAKEIKRASH